jgi:hypothetical protein
MAALRNLVIGLMRLNGETNIAAACRRFAAQPWAALALIGIERKTIEKNLGCAIAGLSAGIIRIV